MALFTPEVVAGAQAKRKRSRYVGINVSNARGRAATYDTMQTTGVSESEAQRMAKRASPGLFGLKESMFPESAPDPEEVMRRQRRKLLAGMRRRSGRMSTILTGGDSSGGMGLG